jgi:opacity protein-like surface antigen
MKNSHKVASLGTVLLLSAATSHANGLYITGDAGGAFQDDATIKNNTGFGGTSGSVKFERGWRAGADVGYNFCQYFSAEFDGSLIYNRINQVGTQPFSATSPGAAAHLDEIPLLLNGVFKWPLGHFEPFVGVGIGAAVGIFDSSNIVGSYQPGQSPHYRASDVTFAYQGEAGFNYSITRHLDVGLVYKFVGTTEHEWNDNSITLKTDGTMTHTILGAITYRF